MITYHDEVKKLVALEAFDPNAFVGDSKYPQEVCDLVLALALVYNDLRDVLLGHSLLLHNARPNPVNPPTPQMGMFGGLHVHFLRLLAGILYELGELIERNAKVIANPAFSKLIKSLPANARNSWGTVVAGTKTKPSDDPMTRFVLFARHKVTFHYDRKEIARGFKKAFLGSTGRPPYVSRGSRMTETRFYFADASAEEYLREIVGSPVEDLFLARSDILDNVNLALFEIVTKFINSRVGWRRA